MKWYNRIFGRLGQRRLFTREEFIIQVAYELADRDKGFMIMPRVQYRKLIEIAANADLLVRTLPSDLAMPIQQRLQEALIDYKLSENTPHSTNAHEEQHLMSIGGDDMGENPGKPSISGA